MAENLRLKLDDVVQVRMVTHDGYIWINGLVVSVGKSVFKVELAGYIIKVLEYSDPSWRHPVD